MVYLTRSAISNNMDAFTQKIEETLDEKLKEVKNTILQEYKNAIDQYFTEKKEEFLKFVTDHGVQNPTLTSELQESVKAIQNHIKVLQKDNKYLRSALDNVQQYTRRPNLRLYDIPVERNETSQHVVDKVMGIISANDIEIPASSIDRAHRIGKKHEANSIFRQAVIVRFTSFRDRTVLYRARKEIKKKSNVGFSLDLTKHRLDLLKVARNRVEGIEGIKFVYSDVNCSLRALTAEGKHVLFDSIEDLNQIIGDM
jgi:chaperonin cofactor prefoldin